jgi:hypothetical protein
VNKNCFIVYSPLHAYIADSIISCERLENVDVYMPKAFNFKFVNSVNIRFFYYGGSQVSQLTKLWYFFLDFILMRSNYYEKLYIPNDADPFVMLLEKRFEYGELNYIEEGSTYLSRIQFRNNQDDFKSRTSSLKDLFKIDNHDIALSSKKIKKAYVFFPKLLSNFVKNTELVDLNKLLSKFNNIHNIDFSKIKKYIGADLMLLTQPLTEDGHCSNLDEVDAIMKVVKDNQTKRIVIRLHYRDDISKYLEVSKYSNVIIMNEFLDIPYQALHPILKPKSIYSFISSVLFSVDSQYSNFIRVSMVDMIYSPRMSVYSDTFKEFKKEFKDFYFYNETTREEN